MHLPYLSPWKSYRQIATQTAPPGQLVLMLFEGGLRYLERAMQGFEMTDPAEANMAIHNNLHRAQEIIRELDQALDVQNGGDCAVTLRNLYRYFDRRLDESNVAKKRDGIEEVLGHLTVLRDAWAAMLTQPDQEREAANEPAAPRAPIQVNPNPHPEPELRLAFA